MQMISDTNTPSVPDATIQNWINVIVAIDRDLSQTAITEANAAGVAPNKIDKPLAVLAQGDADAASGNFDTAIENYRKAWNGVTVCNKQ
jgi:hypothetical protein